MNQFTEYIRQMNDELNALEINSDAYNTVSNKIQQAKDTQSELLGGTKQQVDYGAELANTFGAASNSLSVFADESREAAVAQKALAVAEQLASFASAIHSAATGGDPYTTPFRIAASAAAVVAAFASMGKSKFAGGGIIGGNSFAGDTTLIQVNSGEMVLNSSQQARLWNTLNSVGAGSGRQQEIRFTLRGNDIKGALSNTNRGQNRLK